MGVLSLLLLYYFASAFASEAVARLTAVLFVMWPAQLAFTSVLASEHLALPFLLGAFFVLAKHEASRKLRVPLLAGSLVGLAYVTRPFMIIGIIAAIGFLIQFKQPGRLLRMGSLIMGFLCVTFIFDSAMTRFYRVHNLGFPYQVLLTGTNFESEGSHNDLDATAFWSFSNLDEANQYALQESIRRVTSRPSGFVVLIFKKTVHLWEDDSYGVNWSTYNVSDDVYGSWITRHRPYLHTVCHIFFLFIMILATMGCYKSWRDDKRRPQESLISLLIIGGAGVVAIMETQPRYHYVLMPAVLLFGARAIGHRRKESQCRKSMPIV